MAGNRPSESASEWASDRSGRTPPVTSPWATLQAHVTRIFAKPSSSEADPDRVLTDEEKRTKIFQIDVTERKIGYAAAILGVLLGLIRFVPYISHPSSTFPTAAPTKGKTCYHGYRYVKVAGAYTCQGTAPYPRSHWVVLLVVILVFSLAIYISVRIGRRSAVAFTVLMTGLALMSLVATILAVPFLFAGGWLMTRAWRVQRYGSPTARGPAARTAGTPATGPPARGATSSKPSTARPQSKRRAKAAPAGPAPSKRYTPKTPQRRRPPPA